MKRLAYRIIFVLWLLTLATASELNAPSALAQDPDLSEWSFLMSFRPTTCTQERIKKRDGSPDQWLVHFIEDARGQVNLDFYSVKITKLPKVGGQILTPEKFLEFVRFHFDDEFINQKFAHFRLYELQDGIKWKSANPLDAVLTFEIRFPPDPSIPQPSPLTNPDDASVITSYFDGKKWIFTTLHTTKDLGHPVSGNRMWGIAPQADGTSLFYIRGADRLTPNSIPIPDAILARIVFGSADQLWRSFQESLVNFVNGHEGSAARQVTFSKRFDWEPVKKQFFKPTTPRDVCTAC